MGTLTRTKLEGDMKRYLTKAATAAKWVASPEGRKDVGALVAIVTAIYTALHRAGV